MNFRPRYSLLTLFVLTALVAGGVKLWYGPHHVVERDTANFEFEYTFTRDWYGNKIEHGPFTARMSKANGVIFRFDIFYMRNGKKLPWIYRAQILKATSSRPDNFPSYSTTRTDSPLDPQERIEFQEAIDQEMKRFPKPEDGYKIIEYRGGLPGPND